jgi:hypothetical protein
MKFYTHLVDIEEILVDLDSLNLSDKEKKHLTELVDANLHSTILDAILSELSEEDKKVFLHHLSEQNNDKIWELLNEKTDKIEDKIKAAALEIKGEIHKDIKEAKEKK